MLPLQGQMPPFSEVFPTGPARRETRAPALLGSSSGRTLTSILAMTIVTLTIGLVGLTGVL